MMMKTGIARLENLEIEIVTEIPREDVLQMAEMVIKQECGNYGLSKLQMLGTGAFGRVFAYKDYAIKHLRKGRSLKDEGMNDVSVLKGLQHLDCVPTLYAVIGDTAIITSKVDGMTVEKFMQEVDYGDTGDEDMNFINPAFEELFVEAMQKCFLSGYEPRDLHQANVMIERGTGRPIIVDFGKFRTVTRSYIETLKDENGNIDVTRNPQTKYWKADMNDNVSIYVSAKRNRERLNMKQEKMEQIDAIHNPAEIGELIMNMKHTGRILSSL
ncbi:serine/threonine protein kinase [Bacillus phage vB_BanS-Thrax1]|nr:serine/threonine protein kinase [Bacillus phage vB_BanS-Thrax1]